MKIKILSIALILLLCVFGFKLYQVKLSSENPPVDTLAQTQDLEQSSQDMKEMISGEIKEILERDGKRSLLITDKQGTEYIFHINEHTIVLTFEKLKIGDKVDIIFNGILTRSIPPQGNAIIVDGLKV